MLCTEILTCLVGPRNKAERGEAEEEKKDDHLSAEDALDEGVVLGVEQVHHHVLDQVQVLQLRPEYDQVQCRVGLQFASLKKQRCQNNATRFRTPPPPLFW